MNLLLLVDVQNDFVTGSLGSVAAREMIPQLRQRIATHSGPIIATRDTHGPDYLNTREGKYLPVLHCQERTSGWLLQPEIAQALAQKAAETSPACSLVEHAQSAPLPALKEKLADVLAHNGVLLVDKDTFASIPLAEALREYWGGGEIQIAGICTDICVISHALMLRSLLPENVIKVFADSCAGTSPQAHQAALEVMRQCQIEIV